MACACVGSQHTHRLLNSTVFFRSLFLSCLLLSALVEYVRSLLPLAFFNFYSRGCSVLAKSEQRGEMEEIELELNEELNQLCGINVVLCTNRNQFTLVSLFSSILNIWTREFFSSYFLYFLFIAARLQFSKLYCVFFSEHEYPIIIIL